MASEKILAVITTTKENVQGGLPVFIAGSEEEQQKIAFNLEKVLDGTVHEITPTTLVIIKH